VARAIQAGISHGYRRFLAVVAEGRKLPETEIEPIAQGRIWTGETAQKLGLVDTLGGIDSALERARERAKLPQAPARWLLPPLSARDVLMKLLFEGRSDEFETRLQSLGLLPPGVSLTEPRRLLRAFDDPSGLYAHCLCAAP
jgi:protease-4